MLLLLVELAAAEDQSAQVADEVEVTTAGLDEELEVELAAAEDQSSQV